MFGPSASRIRPASAWRLPSSCGKSQGLSCRRRRRGKYFSRVSLASRNATSFGRRRFQIVEACGCGSRRRSGAISVFVGMSAVERASCESSVNVAVEPLAGQVVAVAEQAGEGDFAVDAVSERTDAGRHRAGLRARPVEPLQGMNENGTP